MARFVTALAVLAMAASPAMADEKPEGTWKWSFERNGTKVETTLKLKLEGDKLTGAITGRDGKETAIEEASYKDGDIKFQVTRERNGQKFTTTYMGKVEGDTLKGKTEFERDGQTQSRDWEAKGAK